MNLWTGLQFCSELSRRMEMSKVSQRTEESRLVPAKSQGVPQSVQDTQHDASDDDPHQFWQSPEGPISTER